MKEYIGFRIEPDQLVTVQQFAKDSGYPSTSSALRRIIQEWVVLKAEKMLREQHSHLVDTAASYSVD